MSPEREALVDKIIADYKEHYDFPPQGESHMHDCLMMALDELRQPRSDFHDGEPFCCRWNGTFGAWNREALDAAIDAARKDRHE